MGRQASTSREMSAYQMVAIVVEVHVDGEVNDEGEVVEDKVKDEDEVGEEVDEDVIGEDREDVKAEVQSA